jgi:hypothetical protein
VLTVNSPKWYHSNAYSAESACKHCGEVIRHAGWCSAVNAAVRYAHQIAVRPETITPDDEMRLHAMGVAWYRKP